MPAKHLYCRYSDAAVRSQVIAWQTKTRPRGRVRNNQQAAAETGQAGRFFSRCASLDTFREAVFRCSTPLVEARINSGWAALKASAAAPLSPAARASSTLRTKL